MSDAVTGIPIVIEISKFHPVENKQANKDNSAYKHQAEE